MARGKFDCRGTRRRKKKEEQRLRAALQAFELLNYWFRAAKVPSQAPIAIGPTACTRTTASSNEQNARTPVVFWLMAEASVL
jgi:hypothetical protein